MGRWRVGDVCGNVGLAGSGRGRGLAACPALALKPREGPLARC